MPTGILSRATLVDLDLFTDAYRVSGRISVGSGGIHAELGDPNSDYLELAEAYISRINAPGHIVASYTLCSFRKDSINFIVLRDRRDGIPMGTTHGRSIYGRGREVEVFLTVPSFEIRGQIAYEGKISPTAMLAQAVSRYQFVFSGEASAALFPEISYRGDLILVDSVKIGIFCLKEGA